MVAPPMPSSPIPASVLTTCSPSPFGKKSSITATNEAGEQDAKTFTYNRQDFWATNLQQATQLCAAHPHHAQKHGPGRRGCPDNVLFEGGAGETVRNAAAKHRPAHHPAPAHRASSTNRASKPTSSFLITNPPSKEPWTKEVWLYDFRTNIHFTLKGNRSSLTTCKISLPATTRENRFGRRETYTAANPEGRWRKFACADIIARDKTNLDIFWLKDKSSPTSTTLPDPDIPRRDIIENIESALEGFKD